VNALAGCKNLQMLILTSCDALISVDPLGNLEKLNWLNLSGCDKVTNASIAYLANSVSLDELYLRQCAQIINDTVEKLASLKSLKTLNLEDTRIYKKTIKDLNQTNPDLKILWSRRKARRGIK